MTAWPNHDTEQLRKRLAFLRSQIDNENPWIQGLWRRAMEDLREEIARRESEGK